VAKEGSAVKEVSIEILSERVKAKKIKEVKLSTFHL